MKTIRILVCDVDSIVRDGIITLLSLEPDMKVIGSAANFVQLIELTKKTTPDVIALELVGLGQRGIACITEIKNVSPKTSILVLTDLAETDKVYETIKAGALGYLLKSAKRIDLLQAIRNVANGQASIQPSIAKRIINEIDNPAKINYEGNPLTPREMEALKLIASGLSNQEIAIALVVPERTVAKYVSSILDKLHLANRTQAALYAIREGLAMPRLAGDNTTDAPPPLKKKKLFGK